MPIDAEFSHSNDEEHVVEPVPNTASPNDSAGSRHLEAKQGEMLPRQLNPEKGRTSFTSELYQGLLPHPDHLERFERLAPGAAERFMVWVEDEAKHRRDMERLELELDFQLQQDNLRVGADVRSSTERAELAQTRLETQTQSRVAMAAHAVAFSLVIAGTALFALGKDGGSVAFGAVGVIYTSGTIAGIFRRDEGKSTNQEKATTSIEKKDE